MSGSSDLRCFVWQNIQFQLEMQLKGNRFEVRIALEEKKKAHIYETTHT